MSKFIIKAGPYGNEIVLGAITKELYEKYKEGFDVVYGCLEVF